LVNSYHLLVCTLNLLYINVKFSLNSYDTSNLHQTLLANFKQTQKLIEHETFKSNTVLEYMCSKFDGNLIEVKTINEHYFRPQIKSLIEQKLLNSNDTNDGEIMNNVFFFTDSSLQSFKSLQVNLRTLYENLKLRMRHLKVNSNNETSFNGGQDVDERLFLINNSEKNEIDSNMKMFKIKQVFITTPSSSLNLFLNMNDFNVLDGQQLDTLTNDETHLLEILRRNEIEEELITFVEEFVIRKCALKINDCLRNELYVVCVVFF
jgi:hypothetical protein